MWLNIIVVSRQFVNAFVDFYFILFPYNLIVAKQKNCHYTVRCFADIISINVIKLSEEEFKVKKKTKKLLLPSSNVSLYFKLKTLLFISVFVDIFLGIRLYKHVLWKIQYSFRENSSGVFSYRIFQMMLTRKLFKSNLYSLKAVSISNATHNIFDHWETSHL